MDYADWSVLVFDRAFADWEEKAALLVVLSRPVPG